jgi:RHS repeat-associated protein
MKAAALGAAMLVSGLLASSPGLTPVAVRASSTATATPAVPASASTVSMLLPALANAAYGGYTTVAYVKNLGSVAASFRIDYVDSNGAAVGSGDSASVQPQATWIVRQDNGHAFAAGQAGSGRITSDQLVASFVNEFAPGGGDATSYSGIPLPAGAGSTLYAPAIASNAYGGYTTGIGLLNLAASSADITITYRRSDGTIQATQTLSGVPAGAYRGVYSGNSGSATDANLPANFAGTATIQSSAGSLAAVVNEVGPGGQFSSYDAVAQGATTTFTPVILNNAYGGFNTGIGLQNVGTATANLTIAYAGQVGSATNTQTFEEHPTLAAGGYVGDYNGGGASNPVLPNSFHGSATIKSDQPLAAIVNEVAAPPSGSSVATQSTSYNSFIAGVTAAHLPLAENAGPDGLSTSIGIENVGSRGATVTITYHDATTGSLLRQRTVTIPAGSFLGDYTPNDLTTPGTRATAVVRTTDGNVLAVIANEVGTGAFMSYDAGSETTGPPPDPATVAPPVDNSVATDVGAANAFLYTGGHPSQTGVAAGTIQLLRASVVRGRTLTAAGQPLAGATLSILGHPEFGTTVSRSDGMFDMVVNGGGYLTFDYAKDGYLPSQRQIKVPWQDYTSLPDVALNPFDPRVTAVDLTSTAPMQTARGSPQSDSNGSRQATVFIPQGTHATMKLPDGTMQSLTTVHVRATEYTVGPNGPQRMPADLPADSGYTYAVDLSADEAVAAGGTEVTFDHSLPLYIENFLGFPVGGPVPTGFDDQAQGQWAPADSGRVVKILSVTGGKADLDIDGSGVPAGAGALASLGITDPEREQLATLYSAGQSLWRVPIGHFSPWDMNWGWGPPPDGRYPGMQPPSIDRPRDRDCLVAGSVIGCQNQALGESVQPAGTTFSLNYASDRFQKSGMEIPLSGSSVPASLKGIELNVFIAGKSFAQSFPALPNQSTTFIWDGIDAYGRPLNGSHPITVQIGYVYDGVYENNGRFLGHGLPITGSRTRMEVTLWQIWQGKIGSLSGKGQGIGGWDFSVHNTYDPESGVLYFGAGGRRSIAARSFNVIRIAAGSSSGGFSGDGGPATAARLQTPYGVAFGADGSLYIADQGNRRIRRVGPDGMITSFAGNGTTGSGGDGGQAAAAQFRTPQGVAIGPDGSVYIADIGDNRIRRVAPNGIITTVAGTGQEGVSNDGIPATMAALFRPNSVAVGPDGSIYISEHGDFGPDRIRRVGPDGIITTFAGTVGPGFGGDGGQATAAHVNNPTGLAVAPDGSLYFADSANRRVRRIDPSGLISTIAGNGQNGIGGDGGPATTAQLDWPATVTVGLGSIYIGDSNEHLVRRVSSDGIITTFAGRGFDNLTGPIGDAGPATSALVTNPNGLAFAPDGSVYVASLQARVFRVWPEAPGFSAGEIPIAAEDGTEVYVFDGHGRHLRTLDALTGMVRYQFTYTGGGQLSAVVDGYGNRTAIERDANGNPTAVVAPFGQRTGLSVDTNGLLSSVADPAGNTLALGYTADGLLKTLVDPRGGNHLFDYDARGRLIRDQGPSGDATTLTRSAAGTRVQVDVRSQLGRLRTYSVEALANGDLRQRRTDAGGLTVQQVETSKGGLTVNYPDGTVVSFALGPDPRWGMMAPVRTSIRIATPSGLALVLAGSRAASLSQPNDPFSVNSLTNVSSINGHAYTNTFTASSSTIAATSPEGRQTTRGIDSHDQITSEHTSGLADLTFGYDAKGRQVSSGSASGTESRTYSLNYDSLGRLASVTDPLAQTKGAGYDGADRLTTETLPDARHILYGYDAGGNLTSFTPSGRPAHNLAYTSSDLLASYTPPDLGTPGATSFTYDADKQLTKIAFPDGRTVQITYDSAGRASAVTLARGKDQFAYDATTGQLASITAPDGGKLSYHYDGMLPAGAAWTGTVAGQVDNTYDSDFRVSSTSVNGTAITVKYDTDGRVIQAGDLTVDRTAPGRLVSGTHLGNLSTTVAYDPFGEVQTDSAAYQGTSQQTAQYSRDRLGRVTKKLDTIGAVTHTTDYQYDAAGRLLLVSEDGTTTSQYSYDSNGNRTSRAIPSGTISATFDAQDRLTQNGSVTYAYTSDGDLTSRMDGTAVTAYHYDELGNLVSVLLPDGRTIDYVIDGQNRRIGKKVNGTLVQGFLYDGSHLIAQLDATSAVVSRFIYATHANVPEYMITNGVAYRIIADQVGSPRLVVNATTGQIVQRIDYDELGKIRSDSNPGFQPFAFVGGVYDTDTKLLRIGARDYDPEVGRWTAKDSVLLSQGEPNLYVYANNDPINFLDLEGRVSLSAYRVSNFIAGFGDAISFGLSKVIRDQISKALDVGPTVNTCSGFYTAGEITAEVYGLALETAALPKVFGRLLPATERAGLDYAAMTERRAALRGASTASPLLGSGLGNFSGF